MTLGSITVRHQNGQRYAANNLQVLRKSWGEYEQCILVFECSGVLTTFDWEDVAAIEVNSAVLNPPEKVPA